MDEHTLNGSSLEMVMDITEIDMFIPMIEQFQWM